MDCGVLSGLIFGSVRVGGVVELHRMGMKTPVSAISGTILHRVAAHAVLSRLNAGVM